MQDQGQRNKRPAPPKNTKPNERPEKDGYVSMAQAMEEGETPLESREEKLRRLKEQVKNGSYKPNLRKVAMVLMHDDTDSLVGP